MGTYSTFWVQGQNTLWTKCPMCGLWRFLWRHEINASDFCLRSSGDAWLLRHGLLIIPLSCSKSHGPFLLLLPGKSRALFTYIREKANSTVWWYAWLIARRVADRTQISGLCVQMELLGYFKSICLWWFSAKRSLTVFSPDIQGK